MNSTNKKLNFYYSSLNAEGESVYKCLIDKSSTIKTLNSLDYRNTRNYRMGASYTECDTDLFKFRNDLKRMNEDILSKSYFSKISKTWFGVNVFNYNTLNESVLNTVLINCDQKKLKDVPKIQFKEFCLFENCLSAGLMTIDRDIIEKPMKCYGYDYSKFYYNIMKKIQVPICAPAFQTITAINFKKLGFGMYRCKVLCNNKDFMNCFNFNKTHHYTHNTIKTLYLHRELYDISFELLEPNTEYNYNVVQYAKTIELKVLLSEWFSIMDDLIKRCSGWLSKSYVSQAWGNICKFKKIRIGQESDLEEYDWDHLSNITYNNKYEHYKFRFENGKHIILNSDNAYNHVLARMKPFLTEYARLYIFNFISDYGLASDVIRIQTDGIVFKTKYDFSEITYAPIAEDKTTGNIKFYNLNSYFHVCKRCKAEYKFYKGMTHECN